VKNNQISHFIPEGMNASGARSKYLRSYHSMKNSAFSSGRGVSGLCIANFSISSVAVPDADERRSDSKDWRNKCSAYEIVKIMVGNCIYEKAINSSLSEVDFLEKCDIAFERLQSICGILDLSY